MKNGEFGRGPFTLETRKEMLRRLLQLQKSSGFELSSEEELMLSQRSSLAESRRTVLYCPCCPSPIWQQKGGVGLGIFRQLPCGRRSECSRLLHPQVA